MIDPLLAAEAKARAARRGIWSTDAYQNDLHLTSFHANAPGPDETDHAETDDHGTATAFGRARRPFEQAAEPA